MYKDISFIDLALLTCGVITVSDHPSPLFHASNLNELISPEFYQSLIDMGIPLDNLAQTGVNPLFIALIVGIAAILGGLMTLRFSNKDNQYKIYKGQLT